MHARSHLNIFRKIKCFSGNSFFLDGVTFSLSFSPEYTFRGNHFHVAGGKGEKEVFPQNNSDRREKYIHTIAGLNYITYARPVK